MQKAKTFKLSQRKNVLRKSLEENFEKFPKQAKITFIRKNEPTNKNEFSGRRPFFFKLLNTF